MGLVEREPLQEAGVLSKRLQLLAEKMTTLEQMGAQGSELNQRDYQNTEKSFDELVRAVVRSDALPEEGEIEALGLLVQRLCRIVVMPDSALKDVLGDAQKTLNDWRKANIERNSPTLPTPVVTLPDSPVPEVVAPPRAVRWHKDIRTSPLVFNLDALKTKPFFKKTSFEFSKYKATEETIDRRTAWTKFHAENYPKFLIEVKERLNSIRDTLGDEMPPNGQNGLDALYAELQIGADSPVFGANIEDICSSGKVALDQIAQAIDDKVLSKSYIRLHLKALASRLAEHVCGPGQHTELMGTAQRLQAGLLPQLSALRDKVAEEIIQDYVNTAYPSLAHGVYHVHAVNHCRNMFAQDLGIATISDRLAGGPFSQEDMEKVHALLRSKLAASQFIPMLAQQWHSELKALAHDSSRTCFSAQEFVDKKISLDCFGGLTFNDVLEPVDDSDNYRLRGVHSFTANLTRKLMDVQAVQRVDVQVLASLEDGDVCGLGEAIFFRPLGEPTAIQDLDDEKKEQLRGGIQSPAFAETFRAAVQGRDDQMINLLDEVIEIGGLNPVQKEALFETMNFSSADEFRWVLKMGAPGALAAFVNVIKNGGSAEIKEILLEKDSNGHSALHRALKEGHKAKIKVLGDLMKNCGLSDTEKRDLLLTKDSAGDPGLHLALKTGLSITFRAFSDVIQSWGLSHAEMKELLQTKDATGKTALQCALEHGGAQELEALFELIKSCDLSGEDKRGFLLTKDSEGNSGLHLALEKGQAETFKAFTDVIQSWGLSDTEKKELLKAKSATGATVLNHALVNGATEKLEALCELIQGCDLRDDEKTELLLAKSNSGLGGLYFALCNRHAETVKIFGELIKNSGLTDADRKLLLTHDTRGPSALGYAYEHTEVVKAFYEVIASSGLSSADKKELLLGKEFSAKGESPTYNADLMRNAEALKMLGELVKSCGLSQAEMKAFLRAAGDKSRPILFRALERGDAAMVKVLGELIQNSGLNEAEKMDLLRANNNYQSAGLNSALHYGHAEAIEAFGEAVVGAGLSDEAKKELLRATPLSERPGVYSALMYGGQKAVKAFVNVVKKSGLNDEDKMELLLKDRDLGASFSRFVADDISHFVKSYGELIKAHGLSDDEKKRILRAEGENGKSGLSAALEAGRADVVQALGDLIKDIGLNDTDMIDLLLSKGNASQRDLHVTLEAVHAESVGVFAEAIKSIGLSGASKKIFLPTRNNGGVQWIHSQFQSGNERMVRIFCEFFEKSGLLNSKELTEIFLQKIEGKNPALRESLLGEHWGAFSEGLELIERQVTNVQGEEARDLRQRLVQLQQLGAWWGNSAEYNQMARERPDVHARVEQAKVALGTRA